MNADARRMVALLECLAPDEGYNLTALDDVRFLRSNRPLRRTPVLYDPGIVVVCQGRKRGYFGDRLYLYDAQHVLAVSVPVPFSMETDATADEPLLAIYLHLDFEVAADLLTQLDASGRAAPATDGGQTQAMVSTPMDAAMRKTIVRLLEAMASPQEAAILGPGLVRELYFRVLTSEQGGAVRAALAMRGQFGKITKAIRKIHRSYAQALDVERLASIAGMSVPSFHAHFRHVAQTSPMQYLKSTRLHQARLLMLRNDLTAAGASARVGYESASQFSREFKRLFGRTPRDEVARMKATFAMPPPSASVYVSSH